jgi:outer membrane protein TolC
MAKEIAMWHIPAMPRLSRRHSPRGNDDDRVSPHATLAQTPLLVFALFMVATAQAQAGAVLTLTEAEQIAIGADPVIAADQARAQALSEDAVADGQLPDPRLRAGVANLPLDTFELNQEPMTQLVVGVEQSFPPGDTLRYRRRQGEWRSAAEQASAKDTTRKLIRDVRSGYLEVYYQLQAGRIVAETRAAFDRLVGITRAQYATGRVTQQDVLGASLELVRLDDRATQIRNAVESGRAALGKWLGEALDRPLDDQLPELPPVPPRETLLAALPQHPAIRAESARIESESQAVRIAREQYKPGWSVGLEYGQRYGQDANGDSRPDLLTAMVSVELPLFPGQRQDRRLAASLQQAEVARFSRANRLRELKEMLETEYANWQRLGERAVRYDTRLLPEADANAEAALHAYQSGVTDFGTLMRADITDLDVRLEALRVRVERLQAQARLLYLAGDEQ